MAGYIGSKASVVTPGAERKKVFSITTTTTSLTGLVYTPGFVHVFHNGVRLVDGTDYTATNGTSITLTTAAQNGDEVVVISFATFQTSDTVSASAGGTFTGDVTFGGNIDVSSGTIKLDGAYPVGSNNVALGNDAFANNVSGAQNTALGERALNASTTTSWNTAVGYKSSFSNTSGTNLTSVGSESLILNTSGSNNTALGTNSLYFNTSGSYNTGVGTSALQSNTTADNNTAVGYQAAYNTTGTQNTAVGSLALKANTTGIENTAQGFAALDASTTGNYNTAFGAYALTDATTASNNTAVGRLALADNTTASEGTAIGWEALRYNTTGILNTAVGAWAGHSNTTSQRNTFIGHYAGQGTTGGYNTFVGQDAGYTVTSGNRNTILGRYSGNQAGLDIRTSSGVVVLSDGDGNVFYMGSSGADPINRFVYDGYGLGSARLVVQDRTNNYVQWYFGSTQTGSVTTNGSTTSYNTSSDYRIKENVVELTGATDRLKQIPVHRFNFIADADTTVDGFLAHEVQAIVPEAVTGTKDEVDADGNPVYQGIDQSKLVPLLVATIKELEARIAALEAN